MADATGEARQPPLRAALDHRIGVEFHGARITSDGGPPACREPDDARGLTTMGASALPAGRRGNGIRRRLLGLLRHAAYGRLAGHEDVDDAARLAQPTNPARRGELRAERESPVCEIPQTGLRPQADAVPASRIRGIPA